MQIGRRSTFYMSIYREVRIPRVSFDKTPMRIVNSENSSVVRLFIDSLEFFCGSAPISF